MHELVESLDAEIFRDAQVRPNLRDGHQDFLELRPRPTGGRNVEGAELVDTWNEKALAPVHNLVAELDGNGRVIGQVTVP